MGRRRKRLDVGHKKRKLWARVRREHSMCRFCGLFIDKDLKWPHPLSFTVDHIEPHSRRPDLALVYSNLAAAHKKCNEDNKPKSQGRPSRDW